MRALFGSEIARLILTGFVAGALAVGATNTMAQPGQGAQAASLR